MWTFLYPSFPTCGPLSITHKSENVDFLCVNPNMWTLIYAQKCQNVDSFIWVNGTFYSKNDFHFERTVKFNLSRSSSIFYNRYFYAQKIKRSNFLEFHTHTQGPIFYLISHTKKYTFWNFTHKKVHI